MSDNAIVQVRDARLQVGRLPLAQEGRARRRIPSVRRYRAHGAEMLTGVLEPCVCCRSCCSLTQHSDCRTADRRERLRPACEIPPFHNASDLRPSFADHSPLFDRQQRGDEVRAVPAPGLASDGCSWMILFGQGTGMLIEAWKVRASMLVSRNRCSW